MVELGVFLPVCNNGYIVSTAAPQYQPSYAMNKAMTLLAEDLGFSFVLSPVKYRGFGGPTEQWDYVWESFAVMAALAEATDRIQLYGSVTLPTVHPAITARRGTTIDHIAQGGDGCIPFTHSGATESTLGIEDDFHGAFTGLVLHQAQVWGKCQRNIL